MKLDKKTLKKIVTESLEEMTPTESLEEMDSSTNVSIEQTIRNLEQTLKFLKGLKNEGLTQIPDPLEAKEIANVLNLKVK